MTEKVGPVLDQQPWVFTQTGFDAAEEPFFQTTFALTNGSLGIRPIYDIELADQPPGAFLAGKYGPGLAVPSELVAIPECTGLALDTSTEWALHEDTFIRQLNLRTATLTTRSTHQGSDGRMVRIDLRTFLPAHAQTLLATEIVVVPDWTGRMSLGLPIDWRRGNRYMGGLTPEVETHHMADMGIEVDQTGFLDARFSQAGRDAETMRLAWVVSSIPTLSGPPVLRRRLRLAEEVLTFEVRAGEPVQLRRVSTIQSEHVPDQMPSTQVRANLEQLSWDRLVADHETCWEGRWQTHVVEVDGPLLSQAEMNFATFQTMQAVSWTSSSQAIPARGVTSEYHSGHSFFNTEFFEVPYWAHQVPDIAHSLLAWRAEGLSAAKAHAEESNMPGARYPEEADGQGRPASPHKIHEIFEGISYTEWSGVEKVFLSAAVMWAIVNVAEVSGRTEVMSEFAEVIREAATYGAALGQPGQDDQLHIGPVMGPDEYHYHSQDNFFTNDFVRWSLEKAVDLAAAGVLEVGPEQCARWTSVAEAIAQPRKRNRVVEQSDGFFDLPMASPLEHAGNGRPVPPKELAEAVARLEVVPWQVVKEGDVLLHAMLLPERWEEADLQATLRYYEPITTHESSLSSIPYAVVAARMRDSQITSRCLRLTSTYDLHYQPRANHGNGLHLAVYSGLWQILFLGCLDLRLRGDCVKVRPWLPTGIDRLAGSVQTSSGRVWLEMSRAAGLTFQVEPNSTAHVHTDLESPCPTGETVQQTGGPQA